MGSLRTSYFLTEGPFGYSRWPTFVFPKVPGRTFFLNLSKIITFAAAPSVWTPFVRNQAFISTLKYRSAVFRKLPCLSQFSLFQRSNKDPHCSQALSSFMGGLLNNPPDFSYLTRDPRFARGSFVGSSTLRQELPQRYFGGPYLRPPRYSSYYILI